MIPASDSGPFVVPVLSKITKKSINAALNECNALLTMSTMKIKFELSRDWASQFPEEAGVYSVFDDDELIYIGETGSLCERMADFLNSSHHILRRKLGNTLFKDLEGFNKATSKKRFPDHIEEKVIDYMKSHLTAKAVVVPFGRTEIEEFLIANYQPIYNKKGKRGARVRGNVGKRSRA